jgi:adenosylcobinamide kinase / adenosylcobinamide-phosphate guanylyltransferase
VSDHRSRPQATPVLLGSLGADLPTAGCGCVRCRAADTSAASRRPQGIRFPGRIDVDGPGPDTATEDPGLWLSTRSDGPGRWLPPGQRLEHAGLRIVSLPAATPHSCVLVVADAGQTLLWAPEPEPLPRSTVEAITDAAFDRIALSVAVPPSDDDGSAGTGSGRAAPVSSRIGVGMAHQLARLRSVRAITPNTTVVAVGLTHDTPLALVPGAEEAAAHLLRWGVRLLGDDAPIPRTSSHDHDPGRPAYGIRDIPDARRTLVLGGASSGKSRIAEALLAAEPSVLYAATGPSPDPRQPDPDWTERIHRHRQRRPSWWRTWEGHDLSGLLAETGPPVLVDSLGGWLTVALGRCGAWDETEGWRTQLADEVDSLVEAWRQTSREVVAVAEEVGAGIVPATSAGRLFREELGALTQRLTAESEEFFVVAAGRITQHLRHRPEPR